MSESSIPSERERQLDALLADFLEAQRRGRAPGRDELLARHPEFAADLAAFLDDQAALASIAPPAAVAADTVNLRDGSDTSPPTTPSPGTQIAYCGDYELLEEIARGGMGIVFKARQMSLNRLVAVKMILSGQLASASEVERFRAEAEAAAGLDHPHVLPIYEVGECDGHQYFSMKLVEGGSLSRYLARVPRPAVRDLVGVLVRVCRAVHAGHQRGILHRDLKPGNILLQPETAEGSDPFPCPFVTDFGLAKRVEADSQLTQSGAVVGTPSYMPPEQARGTKKLTTAADVYALGAILYEVLTGRPPFRGESQLETLLQVVECDPPRPRAVNRCADADLETVCLKCLEKEPHKRYGSAEALADELQRWLDRVPILARPAGGAERLAKWARRRPAVAALAAALVAVAATGFGGIVWKWQHAVAAEAEAHRRAGEEHLARLDEAAARRTAELAQKDEARARRAAEVAQKAEEQAKVAAQKAQKQEARARADEEVARKAADAARTRTDGLRLAAEADAARARDPGLALLLAVEGAQKAPAHLTFSALYGALGECRELLAIGDGGRDERGWHIYRGLVTEAQVLPNGKQVLSFAGASLRVHDIATGKQLQEWPGYNLPLSAVALDPEGKRAVVIGTGFAPVRHPNGVIYNYTDRLAYILDLTTNQEVCRLRGAKSTVVSAEFSPDGKRVVTASSDGEARLYDAASGKMLVAVKPPNKSRFREIMGDKSLLLARFTPDGKHILTVTTNDQRFSYLYDSTIGLDRKDKPPTDPEFDPQYRPVGPNGRGWGSAQFNFDGESVMGHLWDATTGKQVASYYKAPPSLRHFGHVWRPQAAAASADGAAVAITLQGVVTVWETRTGAWRCDLVGHEGAIPAVAFSPDGRLIATAGADKTVRVWDAATGREKLRLRGHTEGVSGVRFDRTGKLLASWSTDQSARVWDAASGVEKVVVRGHNGAVTSAAFTPAGQRLVTAGDKTVRVWNLEQPRMPDTRLDGHKAKVTALTYSPDGRLAVTAAADGSACLWDSATGKLLRTFGAGLGEVRAAQFSPDGKRLVTAASLSTAAVGDKVTLSSVLVWDVATGQELLPLKGMETGALHAAFIDDGKKILTVGDGYVRVKRVPGKPSEPAKEVKNEPDGVTISIERGASTDAGRVQLWDTATGMLLADVPGTTGWMNSNDQPIPAVSRDGTRLIVFDHKTRLPKVYDAASGKVVTELRGPWHWQKPTFQFSADGQSLFYEHGGDINIHDTATGARVARLSQFPRSDRRLALSGNGKRLAVAADKFGFVWDVEQRSLLSTLRGHETELTTIALNADGSQVLTGSRDQTAGLWDASSGRMLALFKGHVGAVREVAFRPDGKQVATVGEDGTARLWPTDLWSVVLPRRTRTFTEDERDRYELPPTPGTQTARKLDPKFDPPPGTPLPGPFRRPTEPADPIAEKKAAEALAPLKAEVERGSADSTALQKKLVELRTTYPATAAALEAARFLERLPGPLSAFNPAKIAAAERTPTLPKDVVAVLGESGRRQWSGIDGLALSSSGKVLASWVNHYTVYLWDAETLAARGRVQGGFLGFRADEILVVDNYESLGFWDVSGAEPRPRAKPATGGATSFKAVSRDGCRAIGFANHEWETVALWDLKAIPPSRRTLLKLPKGRNLLQAGFSPDSRIVVLALDQKEVYLFDLGGEAPKQRAVLPFPGQCPHPLTFSSDGKLLAGCVENGVRVWDISAEEPRLTTEVKGFKGPAALVAFSLDRRALWTTSWSGPVRCWDLTASPPKEASGTAGVVSQALAVSPDGKRMFTAEGVTLRAWELVGGVWKERLAPRGHTAGITTLAFSPDDLSLFSADSGEHVRLWSLQGGTVQERDHLPGTASNIRLGPDGRDLIAGRSGFTVWDVRGGTPKQRTRPVGGNRSWSSEQALSGNGKLLARNSEEPSLMVFDLTGAVPRQLAAFRDIGEGHHGVQSLAFTPDGRLLFAAADNRSHRPDGVHYGMDKGPVCVWQVSDKGLTPLTFPWMQASQLAVSPDGRTLAAATPTGVELWDLTQPVPQLSTTLPKDDGDAVSFCYTPAGDRIVTWQGTKLAVWDLTAGKKRQSWTWPGRVSTVVVAHDGRHLAVGNANGTISLLRMGGE